MLLDVPPRFLAPPSAASFSIGRKQVVSVDIADANPQHIVTASVIGLHLLQVAARAPKAAAAETQEHAKQRLAAATAKLQAAQDAKAPHRPSLFTLLPPYPCIPTFLLPYLFSALHGARRSLRNRR